MLAPSETVVSYEDSENSGALSFLSMISIVIVTDAVRDLMIPLSLTITSNYIESCPFSR